MFCYNVIIPCNFERKDELISFLKKKNFKFLQETSEELKAEVPQEIIEEYRKQRDLDERIKELYSSYTVILVEHEFPVSPYRLWRDITNIFGKKSLIFVTRRGSVLTIPIYMGY